jgi:hypothetical protein
MRLRRQIIAAAVTCSITLHAPFADAAMVYRWVDEKGVVHFGDAPPAGTRDYQSETLPDAPPAPRPAAPAAQPVGASKGPSARAAAHGEPARVVLLESKTMAVGPSRQAIRGKVKNDGGAEARDIVISVLVTEPIQGAECLRDVIDVDPSTLAPGAEGSFAAEFDNPCFYGPTNAALTAEWR